MQVMVRRTTDDQLFRDACESTLRPGMTSKVSFRKKLQCDQSPIRTLFYWVRMEGIPTFVSVHLVRHHAGVDHFVMSNRDDRGGDGDGTVTRNSPVTHSMHINAQALVTMSGKRLCLNSHKKTVAVWTKVCNAVAEIDADIAPFLVPACVQKNGLCPELHPCKSGPAKVCSAYTTWPGVRA